MELNLDFVTKIASNIKPLTTLIISFFALIISFFSLMNSRYVSKLTKEKLRLDLYNKRFEIYIKILDYSMQFRLAPSLKNNDNKNLYRTDYEINFIKAFRESKFLFKSNSLIYEIIEDIKNECSAIFCHYTYPEHRLSKELILSKQDSIEEKLTLLEDALLPYLKFELVYNQKSS